jgi:Asp-tRNA(Asn)/Glu-tRNA(Gln) amidotransferase A subunit family amidase
MNSTPLHLLSAAEAARWIRAGKTSSEALVSACLRQIHEREDTVRAFQFLDPEYALAAARAADAERLEGGPIGPLHGVPVGIKDIIDTADMPTERGSPVYAGRVPNSDASVVTRLRAAGAIVLGKTVTTEFALFGPGKTRNPHDPRRTPGGSSSGSAAAVAADMLPIAIGSQTNGSTIRPAAFCGVLGYKPTRGLVSRHGMLTLSPSLDHVGLFSRSVEDLALLGEVLCGFDERDPGSLRSARLPLLETAASEPPPPRFAFVKTPHWSRADADTRAAWQDLCERLAAGAAELEELELFPSALEAWRWHQTILEAELALHLDREWQTGAAQLSSVLREQIERGRQVSAFDYQYALARIEPMYASFAELFEQSYDAILTPAALGEAPLGLESTGDPAFCTLWTLCGMPAVSLPLLETPEGLPLGVQVVGARRADGKLLRTARWLAGVVAAE